MPLEDLNRKIYDPNSEEIANRSHSEDQFNPVVGSANPNPFEKEEQWERYQKKLDSVRKKKLLIGIAIGFLVVALTAGFLVYQNMKSKAFFEDQVAISFQGPNEADSTKPVKYTINYKNDNAVTLKNVEITLNYPENFQPTDNVNLKILNTTSSKFTLETNIKPHSEGSVELSGVFYAPKDFPVYLRASMKYVPSNGTREYDIKNQYTVNISSSPVALDLIAADEVSSGDEVEYVIDYKNPDIRALKDIRIKVEYPDGFVFSGANPAPSENNSVWYVGNLESQQGGKIQIKGVQNGLKDESKPIKVMLGYNGRDNNFIVFSEKTKDIKITMPILSISQALQDSKNGNVSAGDNLVYIIKYQNNGEIGLRNAIVSAEIKGTVLDFSKLSSEGGFFNAEKGLITWQASEIPALANIGPREGGEIRFSVPVKSKIPVQNENDKNFIITSLVKIDSPDIPTPIGANKIIGSSKLSLKLRSKVLLDITGFYKDANIQNSGPIPPKVGVATTYVLHWAIASISNDLSDVKIASSLPAGLDWVGKIYPTNGERIAYNPRTKEVVWLVGEVKAGSGAFLPKKEVSFQVSIKPQINQVGQFFKLLNKATLTGKDVFTGEDLTIENVGKDSQLREDTSLNPNDYKIAQ